MKTGRLIVLCVAILSVATPWAHAAQVGEDAPPPRISYWVKNPLDHPIMDGTRITVIELWATWCGPCYAVIPLLTQLQAQYRGAVDIVGVSRETPDLVEPYVAAQGARMEYSVSCNGNITWLWYNHGYYSYAIIVDQSGHVYWQGMADLVAEPLAEAVGKSVFIQNNPAGGNLTVGDDLSLTVTLLQDVPVSYAWTRNGQPVGGNSPTLSLSDVILADQGDYVCTVTRTDTPGVSVQSRTAAVRVMPDGELPAASPLGIAALVGILLLGGARNLMRTSRSNVH